MFRMLRSPRYPQSNLMCQSRALVDSFLLFGEYLPKIVIASKLKSSRRASLSSAIFQFMGGEMVLATAAEAESPRRDLPVAARYMYLLPVSLYLIGIIFVGLCIDYLNPLLPHMHILLRSTVDPRLFGIITAAESPYVVVIQEAGISALPSFLNAAFILSAITAALVSRLSRPTQQRLIERVAIRLFMFRVGLSSSWQAIAIPRKFATQLVEQTMDIRRLLPLLLVFCLACWHS